MFHSNFHNSAGTVRLLMATTFAILLFMQPQDGWGDDDKAALDMLITENGRMQFYSKLDHAQKELMHHQTSTILATYGNYNSYKTEDAGANAFGNDLMRLRNRIGGDWPQALTAFRRGISRDASLSDNDTAMANDAIEHMTEMLAAGTEIVKLCEAGKAYEASLVYRDKSMPLNARITRALYTLTAAARDRFNKVAFQAKYK